MSCSTPRPRRRRAAARCRTCPTASSAWSRSPSRSASAQVLLLDEPAAGVPSIEIGAHPRRCSTGCRADIAILIIEHDMDLVFRFARRITVLVQGAVLIEGAPQEIAADRARAPGLPGRAAPCAEQAPALLEACARATARPWCSRTSRSRSPSAARSRCSAATASARPRLLATIMGHTSCTRVHRTSRPRDLRPAACTSARGSASASCRRSARSSPRSASTRT